MRPKRKAYTRVVKPGEIGTQTFSPSPDLKKLVDDYLKKVQKEVDSGKDANTAFKTKPSLDDLTGNELIELLFYNEKLGTAPIKELNYLDLFSILQSLLEQKVWQLAVQWWGEQETKLKKDTTETVVERPKAASMLRRRHRFAVLNPSDVELKGIEFASGQEPEDNDFISLVTVRFAVSGQSLASLAGKQRRVLFRYLSNASKHQLLSAVVNSRELLQTLKPKIKRFVNEYFVYDLDMDPPRRLNMEWAEESDYPYSAEVHAADETVIFEVELDVMGG